MKIYFLLLTIVIAFTSCNLITKEPDEYYHLSYRLKQLGDFKKGSYWIYHNDSLNINDTLTITDYKSYQTQEKFDSHYNYYDQIDIKYKGTYDSAQINDNFGSIFAKSYVRYYYTYQKNDTSKRLDFAIICNGYSINSDFGPVDYLVNFKLNEIIYDTVFCYKSKLVEIHSNKKKDTLNNEYYFALDKGIIKMAFYYSTKKFEWNLIKSNVIK